MSLKLLAFLLVGSLLLSSCNAGATPAPTLDVNAVNTAIVGTTVAQLSAQFTQTALAVPTDTPASLETPTPNNIPTLVLPTLPDSSGASPTLDPAALPTFSFVNTPITVAGSTPIATSIPPSAGQVNNSTASGCNDALFVGETLPDGSVIGAGKKFTKAWQLQNTGSCTWDDGYVFAFLPDVSSSAILGYDITIHTTDEFTKPGHSQSFIIKLTAPATAGEYKGYWKMKTDTGTYFGPRVYFDIVVK